jgi:helicase
MRKTLANWIADSESWQTSVDFRLPVNEGKKLQFFTRPSDFYIALFGELHDVLDDSGDKQTDLLALARGLEIYSLKGKRDNFQGVNQANNILYASGLYFLSEYPGSAYILANLYRQSDYSRDIEKFLLAFLQRKPIKYNPYYDHLRKFFKTGKSIFIKNLLLRIKKQKDRALRSDAIEFSLYFLAEKVIEKFQGNNIWADLKRFNKPSYWAPFVQLLLEKSFPVWDFFPSQRAVLDKNVLAENKTISLQTPTSSGKTAICELLIYNEFKRYDKTKVLYLAPFRALAAELKHSFAKDLAKVGITTKATYGGNFPSSAERQLVQEVNLLITTPEKFSALEGAIPDFLSSFTMVICDEGHLLDDGNRGLKYELLLARLKIDSNPKKFTFISAIVPNVDAINVWLGGDKKSVVRTNYRATELEYAFLQETEKEKSYLLDVNPLSPRPKNYSLDGFIVSDDFSNIKIISANGKKSKAKPTFKLLAVISALKAISSGTVALFNPTKAGNAGLISQVELMMQILDQNSALPNPLSYVANSQVITKLTSYFGVVFGGDFSLVQFAGRGALYHHGDLPQNVREIIEDAIRREEIRIVVCTNTIAEGVNLPIKTIVVTSTRRFDERLERLVDLDKRDLKNLFGRAGRAGKETKGLIIVPNPSDFNTVRDIIREVGFEDVRGHLFNVVEQINLAIIRRRLVLSNEILEKQDAAFKELLDAIDTSIIDLLVEEVPGEVLNETINNVINETFANYQSNEQEKNTLADICHLRGQRIRPFIDSGEFKYIKQSGANIRTYSELRDKILTSETIWLELDDVLDDNWLTFILDERIFRLDIIDSDLADFNKRNHTLITTETLKEVIRLWMGGFWFGEISVATSNSVDVILRLFQRIVGFRVAGLVSSAIKIAEMKFMEEGSTLSEAVMNFPFYLSQGMSSSLQLTIFELGFNDRLSAIAVAALLTERDIKNFDIRVIRSYLRSNEAELLRELNTKIPDITYEKTQESFRNLRVTNMK